MTTVVRTVTARNQTTAIRNAHAFRPNSSVARAKKKMSKSLVVP